MTREGDLIEFNIILAGRVEKGFLYELGHNAKNLVALDIKENFSTLVIGLPKPDIKFRKRVCGWGNLVIQTRLDDPKNVLDSLLVVEELSSSA